MPKPKAVYIIGGAGSGKSSLMGNFLKHLGAKLGPLEDLHVKPNKKNDVTLRGSRYSSNFGPGLYLGLMREEHPGTDGLDRASTPTAVEWLELGDLLGGLPNIISEGNVLATKPFFKKLSTSHDLLVVHLLVSDEERLQRLKARGTNQKSTFVAGTVTRGKNMARFAEECGAKVLEVDTESTGYTEETCEYMTDHLTGGAR